MVLAAAGGTATEATEQNKNKRVSVNGACELELAGIGPISREPILGKITKN